jgi:hypothetical protein
MSRLSSRIGSRRWLAPVLLLVVPLLVAASASAPIRSFLNEDAADVRADIAGLAAIQSDFLTARAAEHRADGAQGTGTWEPRLFAIRRTLDTMPHGSSLSTDDVSALRAAVESYAGALASSGARGVPATPAAAADGLEMMLGQLQTRDEVLLREPILGLRLAVMGAGGDDAPMAQTVHWSNMFAARLNEATIPDGTRTLMARKFAAYEHDLSRAGDVRERDRARDLALRAAARDVEATLAGASSLLVDALSRQGQSSMSAREQILWVFGGMTFATMTVMAGGLSLARAMPRHLIRN